MVNGGMVPNNTGVVNGGQAGTQRQIHIDFTMDGWLACDNKLFDRTCPSCNGMYSSYEVANCPKCGSQLTFITTAKGSSMAISEGTFYPCLSQKQTQEAGNGIETVYRFKIFSFSDANGVLAPPPEHAFCKKGALVKIRTIGHQIIHRLFSTGQGVPKVESLFLVWKNYGDSVKLLQGPKVSYQVDANGQPAQMNPPYPQANQNAQTAQAGALPPNAAEILAAAINLLQTQMGVNPNQPVTTQPAQPNVVTQPVTPDPQPEYVVEEEVDVFAGA